MQFYFVIVLCLVSGDSPCTITRPVLGDDMRQNPPVTCESYFEGTLKPALEARGRLTANLRDCGEVTPA